MYPEQSAQHTNRAPYLLLIDAAYARTQQQWYYSSSRWVCGWWWCVGMRELAGGGACAVCVRKTASFLFAAATYDT